MSPSPHQRLKAALVNLNRAVARARGHELDTFAIRAIRDNAYMAAQAAQRVITSCAFLPHPSRPSRDAEDAAGPFRRGTFADADPGPRTVTGDEPEPARGRTLSPSCDSAANANPPRVYLAGPMRGVPGHNFAAFDAAAERFRAAGWIVMNPAEMDRASGFDGTEAVSDGFLRAAFGRNFSALVTCSAIALLPGWCRSEGTALELAVARHLGLRVFDAETLAPMADETVLEEAARITGLDRNRAYGHPLDNHGATAALWTAWLRRKYGAGTPALEAEDVCWLNVLQKASREANAPRRDNAVDVAGYVRNLEMIGEERARRAGEAFTAEEVPAR